MAFKMLVLQDKLHVNAGYCFGQKCRKLYTIRQHCAAVEPFKGDITVTWRALQGRGQSRDLQIRVRVRD